MSENQPLALRRSERDIKLTEKGKAYKMELLEQKFTSGRSELLSFLDDTDRLLWSPGVDPHDLIERRSNITEKLDMLKNIAEQLVGLGHEETDCISDLADRAVSTMNKIVLATKHLNVPSVRSVARSRNSKTSAVSSQRATAAADAAALQVQMEALRLENSRQDELERLMLEEETRRREAEVRMASMRRQMEEEKLASQLRVEETRLKILDEQFDGRSCSGLSSYTTYTDAASNRLQRTNPVGVGVRAPASQRSQASESVSDRHLVDALAQAISLNRLPIPEPSVFTGDPLTYQDWLFSFTSLIDNRGIPACERIHYLKRYVGGPAKEAINGFFLLHSENAYQRAREVLEKRFGNRFVVSEAFRAKLDAWPKLSPKDKLGLRKFSDFLLQCKAAMKEMNDLCILNDIREIRKIVSKLPEWIGHRWNRTTATCKRDKERYPNFSEFVAFVLEESEILNDPVLASETPVQASSKQRSQNEDRPRKTVLRTDNQEVAPAVCLFCKKSGHTLCICRSFLKKAMSERKDFVKNQGLCFACLKKGHTSKQCKSRAECAVCKKKHPTCLHLDTVPGNIVQSAATGLTPQLSANQNPPTSAVPPPQPSANSQLQNTDVKATSRKIETTASSLTSMVLPVYVSSAQYPEHEVLVYALLDTMSDSTFVLDSVVNNLKATSEPATLRITTITDQNVTVCCQRYSDLRIRGIKSNKRISLPATYSRSDIPLDENHIPTPKTANQWPHLNRLENLLAPKQECPAGLLIGYNCPRALAPLDCITGEDNQPYAVETELGWSIVGGSTANSESFDAIGCKGQVHCSLVTAKARVAPLKATTIPRLELQAAVLSANAAKFLGTELDYKNVTHHFWTDSKVVLGYIKNETARYHTFVANRVEEIRQVSQCHQWHYVSTKENPADHASRGLSVKDISASNWFTGPDFLWERDIVQDDTHIELSPLDKEVKSAAVFRVHQPNFTSFEDRVARFSSLKNAVSAVATIIRCGLRKQKKDLSDLEVRQMAEKNLIRAIQKEAFRDAHVKSRTNPLRNLDPFQDENNLLRVGGRLSKASDAYETKHPVILPKSSHLSRLIALNFHEKTAHQGRNLTMNAIRSAGYWIVGCRRVVASLIDKCVTCTKNRGTSKGQKMADLPKERIESSPPFTYCGIDCFGPFIVKEGRRELKKYGLIFTCLALRAIHIEVLDDLTTDAFLNGLRCFIAIRGKVRLIRCDQGTNFVGANHELGDNIKNLNIESITRKLLDMDCDFQFNPPSASHMGGVWERQIRSVRSVLSGILDQSTSVRLDTSSLRTIMYEVMAIVNSRPLTTDNLERADGPLPLTPNNLLTMKSGVVMPPPPGKFEKEDLYLKKRWRRVQYLTNLFWTRWKKEYLQTLQQRNIWHKPQRNLSEGDVVLLKDETVCRSDWKMGRVVETFPSKDGLVRRVKLLVATPALDANGKPLQQRTYLERPVHKLVVIVRREDLTVE